MSLGVIAAAYVAASGVADNFDRADSLTSLGLSSTGGVAWAQFRGTWGINGNRAYLSSGTASQVNLAAIESGKADCTVQFTIAAKSIGEQPGAFLRATDGNNGYILESGTSGATTKLYKWVAGGATVVGQSSGNLELIAGDVIAATLAGSSITIKRNGATIITATDSTFTTQTKHGFYIVAPTGTSPATRFDDFSVS